MKLYRVQDDSGMRDEHGLVNLEFGDNLPQVPKLPQSIKTMYRLYGKKENEICGHCQHLFVKEYAGKYFKCDLQKNTNGAGTDWRKRWKACGRFEGK